MSKPDGTILFSTQMDNSELEKQVEDAKEEVKSIEEQINKLNKDKAKALKDQEKAQEKLNKAQAEQGEVEKKVEQANERAAEAKERLVAAQEKLAQIQREKAGYDDARTGSFNPDTASDAQAFLENYKTEDEWKEAIKSAKSEVSELEKELKIAEQTAERFGEKLLEADDNVINATENFQSAQTAAKGIVAGISAAEAQLDAAEEKAGGLDQELRKTQKKSAALKKPLDAASKGVEKFTKRLKQMALRVLVFSTILKALNAIKGRLSDAISANEEASKAVSQLKGAVNTAIQPIVNALLPAVTSLCKALTRAVVLTMSLFGEDFLNDAKAAAKAIDEVSNAKKKLAGFDEITTVGGDDNSTSASYNFDDSITGEASESIAKMTRIVAAAALAVGALLCFSGAHIGFGLALMVAGAAVMVGEIKEDWSSANNKMSTALMAALAILMAALFVIGAILLFTGNIPLGLGMIVAGATVAAAVVNWNAIAEALQGPIGAIVAIVSGALLAIGLILVLTGVGIPIGLGMIVAGAAGLVAVMAVNFNAIVESVKTVILSIWEWITTYGMLVIGILLCLTGGGIPFGIALIMAWAKQNADEVDLANQILSFVQSVWSSISNYWNSHIAKYFTAQWWKSLAIECANGLISGFEGAINGIISAFEKMINWIVGGLNKISFDVPDWVPGIGGSTFGFNIPTVSWDRINIPRLAEGRVLPANHPFLAMVGDQKHGTNVETPLSVIQDAVALVMEDNTNGMMAGFEALQVELQRLCAIVEAIEVGDSTIGQAANRYNQRMSIIRG